MSPSAEAGKTGPLHAAILHFRSEAKLAAAIGVTQTAINKAKHREKGGHPVSAELAVKIEKATDGKFPRAMFRPDLWEEVAA